MFQWKNINADENIQVFPISRYLKEYQIGQGDKNKKGDIIRFFNELCPPNFIVHGLSMLHPRILINPNWTPC